MDGRAVGLYCIRLYRCVWSGMGQYSFFFLSEKNVSSCGVAAQAAGGQHLHSILSGLMQQHRPLTCLATCALETGGGVGWCE